MSRGSLEETKYHLLLANDLGYINDKLYRKFENSYNELGKMLNGLISKIDREVND